MHVDRRQFLAAAAFFSAHPVPWSPASVHASAPRMNSPLILGLELQTAAPLASMRTFYQATLGLRVLVDTTERLTIDAGATRISFVPSPAGRSADPADGAPFYHFAFNIPENKILAAHRWQSQRTPLLPIPARLRDANYPADVVNYSHWNAHSIFFFDPASNVVEYIARHDLRNAAPGEFDSADILYASEIAFVVDEVGEAAAKLKEIASVQQYRGGDDQFTALGDEHGLLLVMKRGRVISFDAEQRKAVTVFATRASIRAATRRTFAFPAFPYELDLTPAP
jgi:hypothetical protein